MKPAWVAASEGAIARLARPGGYPGGYPGRMPEELLTEVSASDAWFDAMPRAERLYWLVVGHSIIGNVPSVLQCYRMHRAGLKL